MKSPALQAILHNTPSFLIELSNAPCGVEPRAWGSRGTNTPKGATYDSGGNIDHRQRRAAIHGPFRYHIAGKNVPCQLAVKRRRIRQVYQVAMRYKLDTHYHLLSWPDRFDHQASHKNVPICDVYLLRLICLFF